MTGVPLRRRLFLLSASGILPLALVAGVGLHLVARQQRAQAQAVGVELARSVATAVEAEQRVSITMLEALATSPTLDARDLDAFRARARRLLTLQPHWSAITLAGPDGTLVTDARAAGPAPRSVLERPSFDRVVRERVSVAGSLARSAGGSWFFPVRSPVVRDGVLRYVLTAEVDPEKIRGVLTRQRVPADWVISIVDEHGRRVARSRAHEQNLGGWLSPSVQQVVAAGGAEGFGVAHALEGQRIFTPFSRLASSRWTAVLGIPTHLVDGAVMRSLAVYGGGVVLSIVLGTLAALAVARSINEPIGRLRAAANALARKQPPPPQVETPIQEIREVAAALSTAAAELASGERERDELLLKERSAREAAESADRTKEEFLAVLSHELRTPLNAVYGWARLLQGGQLDDPQLVARATDAILRNADVQVQLIDDLLDLSRITSGKMRVDLRPVAIDKVLQGALDAVRPAADAKRIGIQTVLDSRAGPVLGDAGRLQQVAWNLLMNAVKFTPREGRVQLRLRRAGAQVEILVSDTGQGIAADVLPHVFERFKQGDSSSTRAHGGLGLGLALVKHLVELHGGRVLAESAGEGRGATFTVVLPLAAAELASGTPARTPVGAAAAELSQGIVRLDGLRVLVADDDRDAVGLAEAILAKAGAEVRTCLEAPQALELLRRWRPDVLVSDIEMPGEDGYSLIRKVRALAAEQGGATPAIALTAYGRSHDRARSLAAGYSMHVPKPVDPGELTAIIASLAQRPSRRQAGGPEQAGTPQPDGPR
jgi:signal transduction histidine kinase/ActR/RegA family two-component response regulator